MRSIVCAVLLCALAATAAGVVPDAPDTADVFFYNSVTGASTFARPDTLPVLDEATGQHYWVVGGQATWDPPDEDHAWVPHRDPEGRRYFVNALTQETTWAPPEPGAWEARSVSKKFYHNVVTNETTWTRPRVLGHESAEHNATFYDGDDSAPTWEQPSEARWTAHRDEGSGATFYHHPDTKSTTWEVPAESAHAWQTLHAEM